MTTPQKTAWTERADQALMPIVPDADDRAQMVARFHGQYLPALGMARTPGAVDRVWDAFRYYLTTPATSRKPFALSWDEAVGVTDAIQWLLDAP